MRGCLGSLGMNSMLELSAKIETHYEEAIKNEVQDPYPDIQQIESLFQRSRSLLETHIETIRSTYV